MVAFYRIEMNLCSLESTGMTSAVADIATQTAEGVAVSVMRRHRSNHLFIKASNAAYRLSKIQSKE